VPADRGLDGAGRWVCLDVGETLIDETRVWSLWADVLGVPRLTFFAALGAVIARGGEHVDVFGVVGIEGWRDRMDDVERSYGGFRGDDLYPDALPALARLRARGYRLAVVANQPASRSGQLRSIGVDADVIAMSGEIGVAKPDPAFFRTCLELMGGVDPTEVAYVGDRVDNDVLPSAAAGMRAVWIRRGPWAAIQRAPTEVSPALSVASLEELAERIGEAWTGAPVEK
jgi:HAD superfamily hydrolase (TIGR01662 family)